jgi:2,4-diaminopentanoate dehydrogenase
MGRVPSGRVPVVVMGLGHIGREICRAALASEEVELQGAVDSAKHLSGASLGELLGQSSPLRVSSTLKAAQAEKGAVLLHATGSHLEAVLEQLLEALRQGHPVVSTCEELAFPFLRHPALAERLDRAAQRAGVSMVGTGINPGFVLDRLVATLGQTVGAVRHLKGTRSVDAGTRRASFQRKVGAGLSAEAFEELAEKDAVGHVGLVESAALCALGLGLDCDDFEEELVPLLAEEDFVGSPIPVAKGQVAGVHQTAVGLEDGQERIRLELTLAVGAEAMDRLVLEADTRLTLEVHGGIPGDSATAHLVVHAAPRLTAASPGLLTVLDLPAGR